MAELIITAANFENEVMHSEKPILIDFYADWCGPCQMLAPVVHEIAKENAGVIKVGKINVDEQMELARKFRVFSIPTLVLFQEGKAVSSLVGFHGKEEIEEMLKSTKQMDARSGKTVKPYCMDRAEKIELGPKPQLIILI